MCTPQKQMCCGYDTKPHLIVSCQSWIFGKCGTVQRNETPHHQNKSPEYDIKMHLMVRLQSWIFGKCGTVERSKTRRQNKSPEYDTKLHLMVRIKFSRYEQCGCFVLVYLFYGISTSSIIKSQNHPSKRTAVKLFNIYLRE